ncbi:MAG TPA: hypothetical protein VG028_15935 [Terriglobia bacterium]|nr:hypothetical protein [Terriglobia bacterium]
MVVIISDTHLTDGTSGETVRTGAFRLFAQELRDLAYDASWRPGGHYEPIQELHLLLLGDILDVIRSTQWLNGSVRPWDDSQTQPFSDKITSITHDILKNNQKSLEVLKSFKNGRTITIPPAKPDGTVDDVSWNPDAEGRVPVEVHNYYMVGNHDWFYHLRGPVYDRLRGTIVEAMGLDNPATLPFPHDPAEFDQSPAFSRLAQAYTDHSVFARHGDIYDASNYDGDRDRSSIGDAIVVDLIDRFSPTVQAQLGSRVPPEFIDGLREIDNIRPLSNIPVWIDGLLHQTCPDPSVAKRVKDVWNDLASDFFRIPFVKNHRHIDLVKWAQDLTRKLSLGDLSKAILRFAGMVHSTDRPDFSDALHESAFLNRSARSIVYGHTHQYVLVPLEVSSGTGGTLDQVYINSGTWRPFHELAKRHPNEEEFVRYQLMTYLAFFKDGERHGRHFESWNSAMDKA